MAPHDTLPAGLDGDAALLQRQRDTMRQQDAELEAVSRSVGALRSVSRAIGEELDAQAGTLEALERDVDRTGASVRKAQGNAAELLGERPGGRGGREPTLLEQVTPDLDALTPSACKTQ